MQNFMIETYDRSHQPPCVYRAHPHHLRRMNWNPDAAAASSANHACLPRFET